MDGKPWGEHGLDVESGFAREDILLRRAAVYGQGNTSPSNMFNEEFGTLNFI